jgi:hypothetical protein
MNNSLLVRLAFLSLKKRPASFIIQIPKLAAALIKLR